MAALSYSLAPEFSRSTQNQMQREQHHIGFSGNKALDVNSEKQLSKGLLRNAGLHTMIINPTIPSRNQMQEIRKPDSFTAKLVGATTMLPAGDSIPSQGMVENQRQRQFNFEVDAKRYQFEGPSKKNIMANAQTSNIPIGGYAMNGYAGGLVRKALTDAYGQPMRELYDRLYHKRDFAYTLEQLQLRRSILSKIPSKNGRSNLQNLPPSGTMIKQWPVCNCGAMRHNGILSRPHLHDCATSLSGFSKFVANNPNNGPLNKNNTGGYAPYVPEQQYPSQMQKLETKPYKSNNGGGGSNFNRLNTSGMIWSSNGGAGGGGPGGNDSFFHQEEQQTQQQYENANFHSFDENLPPQMSQEMMNQNMMMGGEEGYTGQDMGPDFDPMQNYNPFGDSPQQYQKPALMMMPGMNGQMMNQDGMMDPMMMGEGDDYGNDYEHFS